MLANGLPMEMLLPVTTSRIGWQVVNVVFVGELPFHFAVRSDDGELARPAVRGEHAVGHGIGGVKGNDERQGEQAEGVAHGGFRIPRGSGLCYSRLKRGCRPMVRFMDVDPRTLTVCPQRPQASLWKLQRQIATFGSSTVGMPRVQVYEDADGRLVIWDGTTLATVIRIRK